MDILRSIFEAGERLKGVVERRDPDLAGAIVQIELHFDQCCLTLSATGDDEVCVEPVAAKGAVTASESPVWAAAIGRRLFDYWSMTNKTGYSDAIQLSFAEDCSDEPAIIQLQALASQLALFAVKAG